MPPRWRIISRELHQHTFAQEQTSLILSCARIRNLTTCPGRTSALSATQATKGRQWITTTGSPPTRAQPLSVPHARRLSSAAASTVAVHPTESPSPEKSHPVITPEYTVSFDTLQNIDPRILETVQSEFGFDRMSKVQHQVLRRMPTQRDLLVKAKTGTGKTLAFLVAALDSIQRAHQMTHGVGNTNGGGSAAELLMDRGGIQCLIVAPTRELALQIADEASRLLGPLGYGVQYLVGGESKGRQLDRIAKEPADFVIATPGRINDMLGNADFKAKIQSARVLVLDEADTILQLGFRSDLDTILDALPKDRQTMLFSATVDPKLESLSAAALKPNPITIDTVGANDINLHLSTHQRYCLAPYEAHLALVRRIINDHLLDGGGGFLDFQLAQDQAKWESKKKSKKAEPRMPKNKKIMVFLPTTRSAQMYAKFFASLSQGRELSVFEIHSAKHQKERTLTSRNFKRIKTPAVLFTSDVSARGVDYPGVDLVIQVSAPLSFDHYVHRIGRTGRGSAVDKRAKNTPAGEGILILGSLDEGFLTMPGVESLVGNVLKQEDRFRDWQSVVLGESLDRGFKKALTKMDDKLAKSAYTAFLGYNLTIGPRIGNTDRAKILQAADQYIRGFGVEERPAVSISFLERMGFLKPSLSDAGDVAEVELVDGSKRIAQFEEDEEDESELWQEDMVREERSLTRKERQAVIEEKYNLPELFESERMLGQLHEKDWDDYMEFKPGKAKMMVEKLHHPRRLGQIGNRPSKKMDKIFSDNDGW
ncbi:hypothetical protein DFQ27_006973 [Actinomortierella ambigua]|uniref:ATP-dependent RNA helicase n=1 Tax=Actinomortierella ambigua TaxID=1343610 RepID=A0A9P6QHT0_9FUNG|nr:hypothetical protein DFQ27_006973 [Actinomortierella ambigua]